jgi:tol-pal system protein YbgF
MKTCVLTLLLFLWSPFLALAQRKEYVELQRDIAILQDQVRTMQRTLDEKLAQMTLLVQQSLDSINKANTSLAVLENNVRDRLREQEKNVSQPVAGINSKVDQLSTQMMAIKESIDSLNIRFGKLEQQMVDVNSAVRTLQAPPVPPGAGGGPGGASAEQLYQGALRDKNGGNLDLALKGFTDYVSQFGGTTLAPNSQYYIGEVLYLQGKYDEAVSAFDLVLEKYQENDKTPDAHYMKGMSLVKMNQRAKARDEFYALIKRYPESELSAKAKAQLKAMGLPVSPVKPKRTR